MTEEDVKKAARKVLVACASKSFNQNYDVCPWDSSNISVILQSAPEKIIKKLQRDVAKRAIEFRRQYGCWGSKHFGMVEDHHREMHKEIGVTRKITKKNYWAVVDICAVNALRIGGQRVGDIQIQLYSTEGIKK